MIFFRVKIPECNCDCLDCLDVATNQWIASSNARVHFRP